MWGSAKTFIVTTVKILEKVKPVLAYMYPTSYHNIKGMHTSLLMEMVSSQSVIYWYNIEDIKSETKSGTMTHLITMLRVHEYLSSNPNVHIKA